MLPKKYNYFLIAFILLNQLLSAQLSTFGLKVDKSGSGDQSIVFIPGLACSGDVWNSTKKKLKKEYACYVLTMPGFVGVKPLPDASFKTFENLIAKFIQENNIQKPIVIGHSLGASLAMALASDYPELVSKLIVVDAVPFLLALHDSTAHPNTSECAAEIDQTMRLTRDEFYKQMKQSAWRLVSDTTAQKDVVDWAVRSDRMTFAKLFCDLTNTDLRGYLGNIKCPALILLQPYFMDYKDGVVEQFKVLQQKKIGYSSTGLHFIMYDNFDWYISELVSFLKE